MPLLYFNPEKIRKNLAEQKLMGTIGRRVVGHHG